MYYFMLGVLPLPIPPSSLEITTPSMNTTVTLINDGEINIPKTQGLREISFDFLLPTVNKYPFSMYHVGNYTAVAIIEYIKRWKDSQYPLPFIVVRMSPAGKFLYFTSIFTLIEDFTFKEDAEEHGLDTLCSIKLKEYKGYATKRLQVKQNSDGTKTATLKKERSTADRVKKTEIKAKDGESLTSAIKREGYDPKEVMESNGIDASSLDRANSLLDELDKLTPEQLAEELPDGVSAQDVIMDHRGIGTAINDVAKNKKALENMLDYTYNKGWYEPWESYDKWSHSGNILDTFDPLKTINVTDVTNVLSKQQLMNIGATNKLYVENETLLKMAEIASKVK